MPDAADQTAPADPDKKLKQFTNLALLTAIALGLLVAAAHRGNITASIAAFGAALAVGSVLGFLFGIPGVSGNRTNNRTPVSVTVKGKQGGDQINITDPAAGGAVKADASADPASAQLVTGGGAQAANGADSSGKNNPSNLEQVSDWVTKLLLGGGLTQMQRIPPTIWKWSNVVALGIDPEVKDAALQAQQAFACGLMVYAFILGFFAGYLITKLQLGNSVDF